MKKALYFTISILFFMFCFITNVYAEDKCDSVERNRLNKEASNVVATYEFVYNEINEVKGFKFIVYNIPSDMYVTYKGIVKGNPGEENYAELEKIALPIDRDTGIGEVYDDNITDAYSIYFDVYSSTSKCSSSLKTIKIPKLKYNKFSDYPQCGYEGMEDFTYCKRWIDYEIQISEEYIVKQLNAQVEKNKSKAADICYSCDENEKNNEIYEMIVKIRNYAIIGLTIGIIVDILFIIIRWKKVGEFEL